MTLTLGPMVKGFASALEVPHPEMERFARVLRDERLLTSGARGVHAPAQQYIDAARLLLALLVTEKAPLAADAVTDFGGLLCSKVERHDTHQDFELGGNGGGFGIGHRLEDAIAELIRIYAEDDDDEYFKEAQPDLGSPVGYLPFSRVAVKSTHLTAVITMAGATYFYSDKYILASSEHRETLLTKVAAGDAESLLRFLEKDPIEKHVELSEKYGRKIWSTREIHQGAIYALAGLFVEQIA